ncbi:hypothetical protein [Streptococcus dentiloxodontae]
MTREEWIEYFETVNGRKPSVQEMAAARQAGEFVSSDFAEQPDGLITPTAEDNQTPLQGDFGQSEYQNITSANFGQGAPSSGQFVEHEQPFASDVNQAVFSQTSSTSYDQFQQGGVTQSLTPVQQAPVQGYTQPVVQPVFVSETPNQTFAGTVKPTMRQRLGTKKGKIVLWSIVAAIALIIVSVGGYFGIRYFTGNIDGTWYSPSLTKDYTASITSNDDIKDLGEFLDDSDGDIGDYIDKSSVSMKVTNDTVKVTATYTFDKDTYLEDYIDYIKDTYSGLEDEFKAYYGRSIDEVYDKDTLEDDLDDVLQQVAEDTHQDYNSKTGTTSMTLFKGKVDRMKHTITVTDVDNGASLDGFDLSEGQVLNFTKKDGKLNLSGGSLSSVLSFTTNKDSKETY